MGFEASPLNSYVLNRMREPISEEHTVMAAISVNW